MGFLHKSLKYSCKFGPEITYPVDKQLYHHAKHSQNIPIIMYTVIVLLAADMAWDQPNLLIYFRIT